MSCRFVSARRALAASVLVAVLAVLVVEVVHGPHHVGGGVTSEECATCVALRAPLVPTDATTVIGCSVPTGRFDDVAAWREPTSGAVRSAASRGPPAGG